MKKLLYLCCLVTLFTTACKKDKDPAPALSSCRLDKLTEPTQSGLTYTAAYDSLDRIKGILSPMNLFGISLKYDSSGRISQYINFEANGNRTTMTYKYRNGKLEYLQVDRMLNLQMIQGIFVVTTDANGRPTRVRSLSNPHDSYFELVYTTGNFDGILAYDGGSPVAAVTLSYDAANSLNQIGDYVFLTSLTYDITTSATSSDAVTQAHVITKALLPNLLANNITNGLPTKITTRDYLDCNGDVVYPDTAPVSEQTFSYQLDSRNNPTSVSITHKDLCSGWTKTVNNALTLTWRCQ